MRFLVLLFFFLSLIVGCASLCGLSKHSELNEQKFRRHIVGGEKVVKVSTVWRLAKPTGRGKFPSKSLIPLGVVCVELDYRIAAGTLQADVVDNSEQIVFLNVTKFYVHPEFEVDATNSTYLYNDIALLELESALTFSEILSPVCLPSRVQRIPQDARAVAIGYGFNEEFSFKNPTPDGVLRETNIPIIPRDECKTTLDAVNPYRVKFNLTEAHICAGTFGRGVFHGDTLMVRANDKRWFQFGIVSSGVPELILAQDIAPSIFANVLKFCDWIEQTTNGEAKCEKEEVHF